MLCCFGRLAKRGLVVSNQVQVVEVIRVVGEPFQKRLFLDLTSLVEASMAIMLQDGDTQNLSFNSRLRSKNTRPPVYL